MRENTEMEATAAERDIIDTVAENGCTDRG
jgi:hypothetical protein